MITKKLSRQIIIVVFLSLMSVNANAIPPVVYAVGSAAVGGISYAIKQKIAKMKAAAELAAKAARAARVAQKRRLSKKFKPNFVKSLKRGFKLGAKRKVRKFSK